MGTEKPPAPVRARGARRMVLDVAWTTAAGYLLQPIMFASTLMVRRQLGPTLVGILATLTLVQSYAQLANLGVLQAAERDLPFLIGANDPEKHSRLKVASLTISFLSGIVAAIGIAVFALVFRNQLAAPLFRGLLVYALLTVIGQWSLCYLAFLRADHQFRFLARTSLVFGVATAALNLIGAYTFGFDGVIASTLLVSLVGTAFSTRVAGFVRPRLAREAFEDVRRLLVTGVWLFGLSVASMALHTIDNVVVLRLFGTEALGLYTIAISGENIVYGVASSAGIVLRPRMQEDFGRERTTEALLRFVRRPTMLLSVLLPVVVAPLFLLLPVVIVHYAPKFIPGLPAFQIAILGITFYSLVQMQKVCFISLDRIVPMIIWAIVTIALCGVLSFALKGMGITGVAVAASIAHLVALIGVTWHLLAAHDKRSELLRFIGASVWPTLFVGMLLALVEWMWPLRAGGDIWTHSLQAIAKLGLVGLFYVPVILISEPRTHLLRDLAPVLQRFRRKAESSEAVPPQ